MKISALRVIAALVLCVAMAAACANDGDSTSGDADEKDANPPTSGVDYEVWFVKGEFLHASARTAEATPRVGTAALESLLRGPSGAERSTGLSSAIPPGTQLLGLEVEDGNATVDLSSHYETGAGSLGMRMRLAQVVYTLTQFPTVARVSFELDGRPISTFPSDGNVVDRPLTRADFEDLAPPIVVDAPKPGADVQSPVAISGTADVFEATVSIRIRDAAGDEIARDFTTATCGTGCRGTYSTKVRFKVDEPQRGTIEVFEESMEDGSDLFVVSVPVMLMP